MNTKHLLAGLLAAGLLAGGARAQSPGIGGVPNPLPIVPQNSTATSYPGWITLGGTAQPLLPSAMPHCYDITSTTGQDLWINENPSGTAALGVGVHVWPYGYWSPPPGSCPTGSGTLSIYGALSGTSLNPQYTIRVW